MKKFKNFREYPIQQLKNLEEAKVYLEVALEEYEKDKDTEAFLMAIRDVAEAQGRLSACAKRTNLNIKSYKDLSDIKS
ncbi:MAG: hypothetical protein L0Y56_08865 [Nitrospira sp.]|nr:hypothetical protein [Nitrospira sp.]